MELDKIQTLQRELEKDLYDLLRTFELNTNTSVESVTIHSQDTLGNRHPELVWVKVDVRI